MTPRPARSAVALRGVAAAAVATIAATTGHGLAQQALPSPWIVVVAFALAAPLCVALAGARLSVPRLAVAVGLSQLAFHLLLRLDFTAATPLVSAPHHTGAASTGALMTDALMTDAAGSPLHGLTPAMATGHVLAAVVTVLVVATGERAVTALVALARRPFRVLAAVVAPRPTSVLVVAAAPCPLARRSLDSPLRRRGPPLAA